jgi:hypothetical protein
VVKELTEWLDGTIQRKLVAKTGPKFKSGRLKMMFVPIFKGGGALAQ